MIPSTSLRRSNRSPVAFSPPGVTGAEEHRPLLMLTTTSGRLFDGSPAGSFRFYPFLAIW